MQLLILLWLILRRSNGFFTDDSNLHYSNLLYTSPNHKMDGENFSRKLLMLWVLSSPPLPLCHHLHSEHQAKLITNIYPSIKNVKWKQGSVTRVAWWGGGLSRILMLLGTSLLDTVVFFFLPLPCKSTSGYRGQNAQEAFFYYWTHNLFIFFLDRGRWKNIGRWLTHKNNNPDKNQISHISKQTSPISKLLSW